MKKGKNDYQEIHFIESFHKYITDSKEMLAGLGVIATITALFLNLDIGIFGQSLKNLQLILLLFFAFFILYSFIYSLLWIVKNTDSWFGGLIVFTLFLLMINIIRFIDENYFLELKKYLSIVEVTVLITLYTSLNKYFIEIKEKIRKTKFKSLFIFLTYPLIFYIYNIFANLYVAYYKEKDVNFSILLKPFENYIIWLMIFWLTILYFVNSFEFDFIKNKRRQYFFILFSPLLAFAAYFIIQIYFYLLAKGIF